MNDVFRPGIGRPADKRASHALPRHILGAAREAVLADAKSQTENDTLALWLALELRRARASFDHARKAQDADIVAKSGERCGPRVKLVLRLASETCVALADATIFKAIEWQSSPQSFAEARKNVEGFTKQLTNSAIPLAYFVGQGSPSVVAAATREGDRLRQDIAGAFDLAEAKIHALPPRSTAAAEQECQAWLRKQFESDPQMKRSKSSFQDEALHRFQDRLTRRGFIRVWDIVAPAAGRSRPGRKS